MKNLDKLIKARSMSSYQKDNFDRFVKKTSFKYTVPSIHIAGTNGKGTTANYLASIYQEAGYKVGLFTSPFFNEINELIRINQEPISDEEFTKYVINNLKAIEKYDLSPFEIEVLVGFSYFMDQKCDIAIIECGLGGEYDATNIFTPILSIITSISLEHTEQLGRSVSEIAEHKAGIIKEKVPVIIGELSEDALSVVTRTCDDNSTHAIRISSSSSEELKDDGYHFNYQTFRDVHLQSKAKYSITNACYALEACNALNSRFPLDQETILRGLSKVYMPYRMDIISNNPLVIVDGAHNPEGMKCLKESIVELAKDKKIFTIFACFKDKNFIDMLSTIGEVSEEVVLTSFPHPRARTYEDYFLFVEDHQFIENPFDALNMMISEHKDDLILVTGSLAFAGYIGENYKNGGNK